MEIFVSHMSALLKVTIVEENFNNLMGRMAHFVDANKPLSPDSSVIFQGAHEPRATQTSFTNTDLDSAIAECPICQHQGPTQSP